MRNTALTVTPVPGLDDPPNVPLHLGTVADQMETFAVPRFATVAARDTAWTSPPNGARCITTDTYTTWVRMAGTWVATRTVVGQGYDEAGDIPISAVGLRDLLASAVPVLPVASTMRMLAVISFGGSSGITEANFDAFINQGSVSLPSYYTQQVPAGKWSNMSIEHQWAVPANGDPSFKTRINPTVFTTNCYAHPRQQWVRTVP